jgi:molybdenum cofactor cytidylyltransferase
MGIPKQLLKWKHSTLLGHAIETSKALPISKTIVVLGANYDRIYAKIKHHGIVILENKDWHFGLGKSIATGVSYILRNEPVCDGILILLPDQPLITTNYLNSQIEAFTPGKDQIIATSYENGKQGVPVLFDAVYFEALAKLNDDRGAKSLLQENAAHVHVVPGEGHVSDIDTMDDYEHLFKAEH